MMGLSEGHIFGQSRSPDRLPLEARARSVERAAVEDREEHALMRRAVGLAEDMRRRNPVKDKSNVAACVAVFTDPRGDLSEKCFVAVSGSGKAQHGFRPIDGATWVRFNREEGPLNERVRAVETGQGHPGPRYLDSEVKIAGALMDWLQQLPRGGAARVYLYSERDACPSCQNVLTGLVKETARDAQRLKLNIYHSTSTGERMEYVYDAERVTRDLYRTKLASFAPVVEARAPRASASLEDKSSKHSRR